MTSSFHINNAAGIHTTKDFLSLVNTILLNIYGKDCKIISQKELLFLCSINSEKGHAYRSFTIPKKSGGLRTISAPNPRLKMLLKAISVILESIYEPSACVMGFTAGRSVVDNAKAHLGQNYILNLDLKDFFPSITEYRLRSKLQKAPYSFSKEVAGIIASSCAIKSPSDAEKHVIPQGSPASPVITNIICASLDRKLSGLAARFHLKYTRYADDMTFSSMHCTMMGENIYATNSTFNSELRSIIEKEGFTINESKTRLQKKGARQEVTGLIVGQKTNVPQKYIKELDILLYVWEKHGYSAAFARLAKNYNLKGKKRTSLPRLEQVIHGKLNYLKMVKGQNDVVYNKYLQLFNKLNSARKAEVNGDIDYLASYSYAKFEQNFGVCLDVKPLKNSFGISFTLNGTSHKVHTSKSANAILSQNEPKQMKRLLVSLCSKNGRCFWLLHNGFPLIIKEAPIDFRIDSHIIIEKWKESGLDSALAMAENNLAKVQLKEMFGDLSDELDSSNLQALSLDISKKEFIQTLLNDKELGSEDRKTLIELISEEVNNKPQIIERVVKTGQEPSKVQKGDSFVHDPNLVVRFLKEFSSGNEGHLKFCTHEWNDEFENYDDFLKKVQKDLKANNDYKQLYNCNKNLTDAIRAFVLPYESGLKKASNNRWGEDHIKIGIQHPKKEIKDWMDANPGKELSQMPLSVLPEDLRPDEIMGKQAANFEDVIVAFKSVIEFRSGEKGSLYSAIRTVFSNADIKPNFNDVQLLKSVDIYTYTPAILNAFNTIAQNIRQRNSEKMSLEIFIEDKTDYFELHILHKNSFANISITGSKLETGSTFKSMKKSLRSLCDFSIESKFIDKKGSPINKRLVLLDKDRDYSDTKTFKIEACTCEPAGFDHIFKFYK